MKAKFTLDGETKFQTLYELIEEAKEKGYESEDQTIEYLHDCYIADENSFSGNFSEWLDSIDEGE